MERSGELALEIAAHGSSAYLDLERDADRPVLAEPDLYLDEQGGAARGSRSCPATAGP